ncbi:MAG: restriction endonuclease subunit S [Endozoicomonas sp.]|uniref:restriction endonuclease subunit S n=1 Tax=Endozoicomonas sp. TaxID=1892382 RepID=UPI003D9B7E47
MDFMEKLLDGVVVEWKPLGEIGEFIRGTGMQKKDFIETGFPAIHYGQIYTRYDLSAKKTFTYVADELARKLRRAVKNDLLLATTSENDEEVVKPLAWLGEQVAISGDMMLFRHKQNVKYLAYFLQTAEFQTQKKPYITGAKVRRVSKDNLAKIVAPIPCPENPEKSLQIQAEIVRILDKFTELTTELTTELNARKKQYHYYRDQLLGFEGEDVEWKTLADITLKSYSGGTPKAGNTEYYEGGTIPWLRTKEVKFSDIQSTEVRITSKAIEQTAAKWIPENCVIVAISGATAGRSAINKIPLTTNQHCCCLEIDPTKALYRYVFHWVSFNYENIKGLGQGARGDLNSGIIKGFKILIPYAEDPEKSLAEQERIASILDKFDALTNSINEGLPREIELRQKQYEYYRDLLLSFPKPEEGAA